MVSTHRKKRTKWMKRAVMLVITIGLYVCFFIIAGSHWRGEYRYVRYGECRDRVQWLTLVEYSTVPNWSWILVILAL